MKSQENVRYLLKTPNGYLTQKGTTEDINSKDIIVLSAFELKGDLNEKIKSFLERSEAKFKVEECSVFKYECPYAIAFSCDYCGRQEGCEFFEAREQCKLQKI